MTDPATTQDDLPGIPEPAPAPAPAFATVISIDGRVMTVDQSDGALVLTIEKNKPLVLDRWQSGALKAAMGALG